MRIKTIKHRILLTLGASTAIAAPLATTIACGEVSAEQALTTDQQKVDTAHAKFTNTITTQVLTAPATSKLNEGSVTVAAINAIVGIHHMPDISSTGATVTYVAGPLNALTQIITATIKSGSTTLNVPISLTFAAGSRAQTGTEKINAAVALFAPGITTQRLLATIDSKLDHTATSIPVATINGLAGIVSIPDTSSTGATVTYKAAAPNGLVQVVTATISATGGTPRTVTITLTFASHAPTGAEKINAAFLMFTQTITAQTLSATIDSKLDHTATSIPVATINGLAGIIHMPDITSTGTTVVYTAAAPNGLTQVVTATISATGGTPKTVTITLTFAPHVPTGTEKINAAVALFAPGITTQRLLATIDSKLDHTATSIPVATINGLAGIVSIPDTSSTGATVTYKAAAPNGLVQVVTATISATGGTSRTVTITLTFASHVPTGAEKINAAANMFSDHMKTQTLTEIPENHLDTSVSSLPVAAINRLAGITRMPDISSTGATVTYRAGSLIDHKQIITATISAGQAPAVQVLISLTYSSRALTLQEKITVAANMFTDEIRRQTVSVSIDHHLPSGYRDNFNEFNERELKAIGLSHAFPDVNNLCDVAYFVNNPDGLTQVIRVNMWSSLDSNYYGHYINIVLNYQPHVQTDEEHVTEVANNFTKMSSLTVTKAAAGYRLPTGTPMSPKDVNDLLGLSQPLPIILPSLAQVSLVPQAPNGLTQVVKVVISYHGVTREIPITINYPRSFPEQEINNVVAQFTNEIKTQSVSATIDHHLPTGDVTLTQIKSLGISIPDLSKFIVRASYSAAVPVGLLQTITVTLSASFGADTADREFPITIVYQPAQSSTAAERMTAVTNLFTQEIKEQKVTYGVEHALSAGNHTASEVNDLLAKDLPLTFPGVSFSAVAQNVDLAALTQTITITISAPGVAAKMIDVHVIFEGVTLAQFKAAYPHTISNDGTTIFESAFLGRVLPADFAFPATVTTIAKHAFWSATLNANFAFTPGIKKIGVLAFEEAVVPAGFRIPETVDLVEDSAFMRVTFHTGFVLPHKTVFSTGVFTGAKLPGGFYIPADLIMVEGEDNTFVGAKLAAGYLWTDGHGHAIADQDYPVPGNVVERASA